MIPICLVSKLLGLFGYPYDRRPIVISHQSVMAALFTHTKERTSLS